MIAHQEPGRIVEVSRRDNLFALGDKRREALERQIEQFDALEDRVFQDWAAHLAADHPHLEEDEIAALVDDQKLFNKQVLLRYGAQTQSVLCSDRASELDAPAGPSIDSIFAELPPRDTQPAEIRKHALTAFWAEPDGDHARYLSSLLDNACIIHTVHIDPKCCALVRGVFQGTIFYLDTNVVYRLLNLQGPRLFFQMHTLLAVIRGVGGKLVISQQTLRELRTSLKANERRIRLYPISSVRLAQLAATSTYENDFISLYYSEYARSQISVGDFAARVRNVDSLLADLGIEIDADAHKDVLEAPELDTERGALHLVAADRILEDHIVTHDAFHRLLILKLRRGTPSFARAAAWFLTCDGKLGRYDRIRRGQDATAVPFCIYPDHCMHMTRWALPRTEDYDTAFVELVASPYVSTILQTTQLPSEAAHLVCARIDQYRRERGVSEDVATQAAVLTLVDKRVESSFRRPASDEERIAEIDEAIGRALNQLDTKTEEAARAKALAHQAALRLGTERTSSTLQIREQKAALLAEREQRAAAEAALEKAKSKRTGLEQALSLSEAELVKERSRADYAERKLRRSAIGFRWAACALLWLVLLAAYSSLPWEGWPRLVRALYEILGWVAACLALGLPFGFRRSIRVTLWLAILGSLVIGYLQVRL